MCLTVPVRPLGNDSQHVHTNDEGVILQRKYGGSPLCHAPRPILLIRYGLCALPTKFLGSTHSFVRIPNKTRCNVGVLDALYAPNWPSSNEADRSDQGHHRTPLSSKGSTFSSYIENELVPAAFSCTDVATRDANGISVRLEFWGNCKYVPQQGFC